MFFEDIGFKYLGPVNGHNIEELESLLKLSKQLDEPVLIHVLTKKGKGYKPAEENPDKFHATGTFDIETGKSKKEKKKDYSKVFGEKLIELAKKNDKIVAITASMKDGTGLAQFAKEFPERFFDIGIAEQHAVCLAAGMAKEGIIPVVPIYASFYQRAYDQVIHDVAMQNLPVVLCVDRAGIVGADGETHQGTLDMAFFRVVPNLTIMAPKNFRELEDMLEFAVDLKKPVVIRYPRGGEDSYKIEKEDKIVLGKAEVLKEGKDVTIIAIGKMVARAMKVAEKIENANNGEKFRIREDEMPKENCKKEENCLTKEIYESKGEKEGKRKTVEVINARFLKPLDRETIKKSIEKTKNVITIEDGTIINGLATAVKELVVEEKLEGIAMKNYAYPDEYIRHGSVEELEYIYGMDEEGILVEK